MSEGSVQALLQLHQIPESLSGSGIWDILVYRIHEYPFRLASFIIFVLAIIHTLMTRTINQFAAYLEKKWQANHPMEKDYGRKHFIVEVLRFLGEVEIIFAIWVIPLMVVIGIYSSWETALLYVNENSYIEPLFVIVVMTLASTRPIIYFAEKILHLLANLFKDSVTIWWFLLLTIGPLLGSLITEPAAMTLTALLLARKFYSHSPSKFLAYTTLSLLFVNVSIGGTLTSFAAPPVLMVARKWEWSSLFMLTHFGWKALVSIGISNILALILFWKELQRLDREKKFSTSEEDNFYELDPIPFWITVAHLIFLTLIIFSSHLPAIFIGVFFLFIGFHQATRPFQDSLNLKGPILVGAFLAGLIIHGDLQGWWIDPILKGLDSFPLLISAAVLSSFNDNAMITYLSSLITNLSVSAKYAVVGGAIAGGGLTVIANAPNPAGFFILKNYFRKGISPIGLFLGAIIPTLIMLAILYVTNSGA